LEISEQEQDRRALAAWEIRRLISARRLEIGEIRGAGALTLIRRNRLRLIPAWAPPFGARAEPELRNRSQRRPEPEEGDWSRRSKTGARGRRLEPATPSSTGARSAAATPAA